MYSLDFEEFLWANGVTTQSILDIKNYFDRKEVVPTAMHEKMMNLFKVGGMPSGSSRKYAGSLMWLYDAGIINFCHNLEIPQY